MIAAKEVIKKFGSLKVINSLSLEISEGEFIAITGASGSGKTTLLNILGLLERPTSGEVSFKGIKNPTKRNIMNLQRYDIGYLFQNYALIPDETVGKNLRIPLKYRKGVNKNEEIKKSLSFVGLENIEHKKIFELSGGEQQRVALARVLLKDASCIFADEPTGNLDTKNRDMVLGILQALNRLGKTIVLVTHDYALADNANRQIVMG